jgi:hypothetical protein
MPRPANPLFLKNYKLLPEDEVWAHYEACLKAHDWQYEYSDDYQVWNLGSDERSYLFRLDEYLSLIDRRRTVDLYKKYKR